MNDGATVEPAVDPATAVTASRRSVLIFLAVLTALMIPIYVAFFRPGVGLKSIPVLICLMYAPAVASLVTRLVCREGFRDVGLRLPARAQRSAFAAALAYPFGVVFIMYAVAWSSGLVAWAPPATLLLGPEHFPEGVRFAFRLGEAMTITLVINTLLILGEELGWRGYLVQRLIDARILRPVLTSGLVWAAFHAPAVLAGQYTKARYPLLAMAAFTVGIVAAGYVTAYLRLVSGSIWPAVLMHSTWNAIQGTFQRASGAGKDLWVNETGVLLVPISLVAVALYVRRTWPLRRAPGQEPFLVVRGLSL